MATLWQRHRLRRAKEARSAPPFPLSFCIHSLLNAPERHFSDTSLFSKRCPRLENFFPRHEKIFSSVEKTFSSVGNFFSSTGVFLENIAASPAPYLRTAERRGDFGFGITEDCNSMFYDDERLVLSANGLRFLAFSKGCEPPTHRKKGKKNRSRGSTHVKPYPYICRRETHGSVPLTPYYIINLCF